MCTADRDHKIRLLGITYTIHFTSGHYISHTILEMTILAEVNCLITPLLCFSKRKLRYEKVKIPKTQ